MATSKGSFAQRMKAASANVENWDDDCDLDGDLFTNSVSTFQSFSSRVSISNRSESNADLEDWDVLIAPNDDKSTMNAIATAKQAGIPIPTSTPASALLGAGSIKRLGKKNSNRKIDLTDDFDHDFDLPTGSGLKLKTPTQVDEQDDDWGEGSLGIRFAGTRREREARGARSSSVSAMSPSMGSCMTLESEDDDFNGLVLPTEPLDFNARLEKLKNAEQPTPDVSPLPPTQRRELPPTSAPTSAPMQSSPPDLMSSPAAVSPWTPPSESEPLPAPKPAAMEDEDDFFDGLDIGGGEVLDTKKLTLNRNIVVKKAPTKTTAPSAARPATTLTFTDKTEKPVTSRIPRPLSSSSRSRLTPLYESGAPQLNSSRPMPTTTSAQLLRAKRSAPLLRNTPGFTPRAPLPFLPAGNSNSNSHHVMTKASSQTHLRRDSDPRRPQSPSMRPFSRMSTINPPDTPSRAGARRELAPSAMARHPQKMVQPKGRKRDYGDGKELEVFDDLPTSATKEKQFEKAPRNTLSSRTLRQQPSISRLPMPDRMTTPMPQTPRSPTKMDSTPRFARDTAASRNAREQRLATMRGRGEGPVAPTTGINWKVHVAAKSPHTSPTAHRKRGSGQKPQLIASLFQPYAKTEKGMVYNPQMQRWEGNDEALAPFTHPNTSTTTLALTTASTPTFAPPNHPLIHSHDRSHSISHTALANIQASQRHVSSRAVKIGPVPVPAPSPPRPALISQKTMPRGVQYDGGMVYDPVKMTWLKAPRISNNPSSPPVDADDDEDPFAGLDDLKDNESVATHGASGLGGNAATGIEEPGFVGEEFDLGPSFIRRQREEEEIWRRKTEGWVGSMRNNGDNKNGGWRWAIRDFAASASAAR